MLVRPSDLQFERLAVDGLALTIRPDVELHVIIPAECVGADDRPSCHPAHSERRTTASRRLDEVWHPFAELVAARQ